MVVCEERRIAARERSLIDQGQSELRRRLDDLPGTSDVGDTRKLHQDLIGGRVPRDYRFSDAQLVDPALYGAKGLLDNLIAERARDAWGQAERKSTVRRGPFIHRGGLICHASQRRLISDTLDAILRRAHDFDR